MMHPIPLTRDLVLVGGGHTHALVLRMWGMNPLPGVRLTVINPGSTAAYSGMLPGFVAGHYTRDELDIDLVRLARHAGARFVNGAATAIDPVARIITVPGVPPIPYDVAAVDVGITSEMPQIDGFSEYAVPAKPLGAFATAWDTYRERAVEPRIVVIGGGVAGVELSLAMAFALRDRSPRVTVIDRSAMLEAVGPRARAQLEKAMRGFSIETIAHQNVAEIRADGVVLSDGQDIPATFVTGAAGARPHDWLAETGLETHDGFLSVDTYLRTSDPQVFAVGDCAHMRSHPRPKAGVYAVRQAPVLFHNLRAALSGGSLRSYVPQRDYLKLVSLGAKRALADKYGLAPHGAWLWAWKDRIDRRFMQKFSDLTAMPNPPLPAVKALGVAEAAGTKPMCGGCGAKVGRATLSHVLHRQSGVARDDIVSSPGDDAAILQTGGALQVLTTDHLRSFTEDHVLMARIAAVHALGDIWAMGAAAQAATANLILPRMSAQMQERTLDDIMTAATEVMTKAGAAIVGGHTSLGQELTIGFSITGLCERAPIRTSGARAGDALILTKAVGTGVLMAAAMAGQARGADVVAAFAAMETDQQRAAHHLRNAHAMTDVTGFGLAGHLTNMLDASGVGASLTLDAVPLLPGAEALAGAGVRSTLFDDNRAGAPAFTGRADPRCDLLFDPQTAGGLLAAVDAAQADGILAALRADGYADAAIIGQVLADPTQRMVC